MFIDHIPLRESCVCIPAKIPSEAFDTIRIVLPQIAAILIQIRVQLLQLLESRAKCLRNGVAEVASSDDVVFSAVARHTRSYVVDRGCA